MKKIEYLVLTLILPLIALGFGAVIYLLAWLLIVNFYTNLLWFFVILFFAMFIVGIIIWLWRLT